VATSEPLRLAALHELGLLDTPAEERFDRVVRLAKRIFDVPTVAVNLIDADRLYTKSAIGAEAGTSTPRDISFCPRTVDTGVSLVIPDAGADPHWADNPLVTGDPGVRFYAAAPRPHRAARSSGHCASSTTSLATCPPPTTRCWRISPAGSRSSSRPTPTPSRPGRSRPACSPATPR
jgi:hypothetical protein